MTGKIAAAVVAAIVLATAGAASAQTSTRVAQANVTAPAPSNSYYNQDYWNAIAPAGRIQQRDPLAGTVFEGVVPY
jgi:ABC-type glycerol-3-phosphate transport system substrate-binding protein